MLLLKISKLKIASMIKNLKNKLGDDYNNYIIKNNFETIIKDLHEQI
jgi:hypothetical protein